MLARVNDNAYKIDLPGDYGVHVTFNVGDLSPYLDGDGLAELRSIPFKGGGDDTVMDEVDGQGDGLMLTIGTKADLGSMAHFVCMVTWIE